MTLAQGTSPAMGEAFAAWLASLSQDQRQQTVFLFADDERFDWHYTPRRRQGLSLAEMTDRQQRDAFDLLRLALSEQGYRKAQDIMRLEAVLGALEGSGRFRDPEKYVLTVFGDPLGEGPWAWRFEGHHLSLNMTFGDHRLLGATPHFLGTNPAVVPSGPLQGLEVLEQEIGYARALLSAFEGIQRDRVMFADRSFGDILAGPGREDRLKQPEGLPASAMGPGQRDLLIRLIETYAGNLTQPWRDAALLRIREAGLQSIHFGWAGSSEPGRPHYFRVHGPAVLIEYDNTRNDVNHVHSVWHDPGNLFGHDLLGAHYRHGHHHA